MSALLGVPLAQAQTYTVLHRFNGRDGSTPEAGLIADPAGNLFGTTLNGGASGYGTVFKLGKTGLTRLHSFTSGADGGNPYAGLVRDSAGNLYGATERGGSADYGTVFKIDAAGTETVLHSFTGLGDGGIPFAGLIRDSAGNLYGATTRGGASRAGLLFMLGKTGETVLYSFAGGADGGSPYADVIRDSAGNLYGTTPFGGAFGFGTVFKVDTTGKETVLYSFTGGTDGGNSYASLVQDSAGNLYGTTVSGGAASVPDGFGVVFKLDTAGNQTVLHTFTGGWDGGNPHAGLVLDPAGNLYGTAVDGGAGPEPFDGVVFKLDTMGTETVLYNFTGAADGAQPFGGLLRDSAGNLYGTAAFGGGSNSACVDGSCGVVFKIAP